MGTILLLTILAVLIYFLFRMNQLGKLARSEKIVYKNTFNQWFDPETPPLDKDFTKVICTIQLDSGKNAVSDGLYDKRKMRFIGMTNDFCLRVIAWMPYPEPFDIKTLDDIDKLTAFK